MFLTAGFICMQMTCCDAKSVITTITLPRLPAKLISRLVIAADLVGEEHKGSASEPSRFISPPPMRLAVRPGRRGLTRTPTHEGTFTVTQLDQIFGCASSTRT